MMMIYGMFVFELRTLPHQQLQQNKSWRHVKNERVNRSASWQYIGAGDDRIVLSGVLYPEITGGEVSLSLLTTQAYTGRPWPLIDGVGQIYGMYVLTETNTTRSEFDRYGKAKKIEFSLTLERCDEDLRERLQSSSFSDMLSGFKDKVTSSLNSAASSVKGCSDLTQKPLMVRLAVFIFLSLPGCFFSLYIAYRVITINRRCANAVNYCQLFSVVPVFD